MADVNWRWLIMDYADPSLPLSWRQRLRIAWRPIRWTKLPRHVRRRRILFGLSMLPLGFLPVLMVLALMRLQLQSVPRFAFIVAFIVVMFFGMWIVCCVWLSFCWGVIGRPEHCHRLRLEGYEVCVRCGYWLRGLDDDGSRCPECGAKREPMPETR